jgi:hypothetical protein
VSEEDLDLVTWRWIQGTQSLLNLYLDKGLNLGWRKTLVLMSNAQGHGDTHAQRIYEWTLNFLQSKALLLHCLGQAQSTVLRDEDIAGEIKMRIIKKSKEGFVKAENLVDLVASPEMQKIFSEKGICKASILKKTATHWLHKLDWRYQEIWNEMYIDGYKREGIVAYQCQFVKW